MAAKDQFKAQDHAKIYSSYRRDTPTSLIQHAISCLKEKYNGPLEIAVDVGCGSGQSTANLAPFFGKVYGMDVSEAQIQEAKFNRSFPNVTYETAPAEAIPFADGSVQVVSAGAALHWFQLDVFFPEARRVLCNNGILVVYCYYSMKPLLDNIETAKEIDKLWKEFYALTEEYHAPQAKMALDLYEGVSFPFEEVLKFGDIRDIFDGELKDIIGYMSSFSGFQNFKRQQEEKAVEYLALAEQRFRKMITESQLDADGPLKLYRDFYLIVCRKVEKDA